MKKTTVFGFLIDKAFLDCLNVLICCLLVSTRVMILTITLCWTRLNIILPGEELILLTKIFIITIMILIVMPLIWMMIILVCAWKGSFGCKTVVCSPSLFCTLTYFCHRQLYVIPRFTPVVYSCLPIFHAFRWLLIFP